MAYSLSATEERNVLLMYMFADKAQHDINRLQSRSIFSLENELIAFITKYADLNNISQSEARRRLTEEALKEYRQKLDVYIEEAESKEFAPQYVRQLKQEKKKTNVAMMTALMVIAGFELERIRKEKEIRAEEAATEIYRYNKAYTQYLLTKPKTVREIEFEKPAKLQELADRPKVAKVQLITDKPDPRKIKAILEKPWADGSRFSDRIWRDKQKLLLNLEDELKFAFQTGEDLNKTIKRFTETMEVDKSNARRLIQTEASRIATTAGIDAYKELGLKKYVFLATLSEKTCPVCGALDGQIFDIEKAEAGVNLPPMHPYCRCTTKAYVPDVLSGGTRAARNPETGKTEIVENQTYAEWRDNNLYNEYKRIEKKMDTQLTKITQIEDETYPKGESKSFLEFKEKIKDKESLKELMSNRKEYETFQQDIKEIKAVLGSRNLTDEQKGKVADLFFRFRDNGLYISDHALERYFEREYNGERTKRNYTYKDIIDLAKKEHNYKDERDQKEIIFEDRLAIIKEPKDHNKIISINVIGRRKPKRTWEKV